jgi:dTDP-glucose 4,6-dehydratase
MSILVTGAAGFIGSNFVLNWLKKNKEKIIALDKLTYAGNLENLKSVENKANYEFVQGDIGDPDLIAKSLKEYEPRAIVNFAAESHVDRSIHGADEFIQTNIIGTYRLLDEARSFFNILSEDNKKQFRFLHVSTDEVYGTLSSTDPAFK